MYKVYKVYKVLMETGKGERHGANFTSPFPQPVLLHPSPIAF